MKKFASFLIFLAVFCAAAFSQTTQIKTVDQFFLNDFVRKNWTTTDGLPGMTITAIMQDKKGYIWLGSYDGLVRFDGIDFVSFNRSTDEKYDFSSARSLLQDSQENIWVGHNDEGVTCIFPDGSTKKYTSIDGLPNNKVNALCEDTDHNIWFGTASGVCYLTPSEEFVVPAGLAELGQQNIMVVRLYCDTAGRVWVSTATENDLFVWSNKKLERFTGITKIKNPIVYDVNQDNSGAFWFGVSPRYAVKIKDTEETVYDIGHTQQTGTLVESIIQDSHGNYWIGSDSGITVMHNGKITYYDRTNGLIDNAITKILEDREGNIWIGFNRGGLQKMSKGKFSTFHMPASVNTICEDSNRNSVWLGADDGLHCYKNNQFVENNITRFCKGIRIRHVGLTSDGELLISSYSDIPQIRVLPDDTIKVWSVKDGIATSTCRVAIKTKSGDYYVGTTAGLSIIHHEDGHLSTLTRADGFESHYIMWLYEDERGRIWAGTNGGGVYVLVDEQIIRHLSTDDGLAGNVIFKISKNNGDYWICTGTGLSKYNEETDSFVNFNSRNGLGTDSIFQIVFDYTQTAWIITNKGILSAHPSQMDEVGTGIRKKIPVRYYGASDGLITNGVTSVSLSAQDAIGRIWFALTDGFSIYDPIKSSTNTIAPKIEIQQYVIDNNTYDYHGETIIIPPSAKRLSIKYTGLSFISSDSMLFRSKLHGFEQTYSEWTPTRLVSYTNLKHGKYAFTIMSQNSDGIQSEPSKPVIIIKKPFLWELVWFWIAIAFVIGCIVALSVLHKIRNMRRYQIELEQKVDERTRELKVANEKAETLLLNILPAEVAKELTDHPDRTIAQNFPNVSVLFTDIIGFTRISDGLTAEEVVTMLNKMISKFDERAKREGIEKIKTIGDAYMAACGLTENANNDDTLKMVRFAQGLLQDVQDFNETSPIKVQIRLGINTGNLVAGVIGKSKFIYDIWGDTVNVASRMESTGKAMKIHVTETTYAQTKEHFAYSESVDVEVKGKGNMKTYFL